MSTEMQTKVQAGPAQNITPVQTGLLQRKYALCNTPGLVEDSGRDKEKLTLQSSSAEPHFGHDFSRVRVHSTGPGMIQAKLKMNEPGDPYEQEADRVADEVMRMPEPGVQRQAEGGEELVHPKLAASAEYSIQRQIAAEEEEELIQTKELTGQDIEITPHLESRIQVIRGSGQPLPESARAYFEPRFGYDFSQVRLHNDARAAESTRAVNARAYTVGPDVVFAPGEYTTGTDPGRRLLAHELAHVVQQGTALPIAVSLAHQAVGRILRPVSPRVQRDSAESAAAGSATQTILPGYSQNAWTCGAASLVTALMLWDREHSQPDAPHAIVVTAINIILTWYYHKDNWNDRGSDDQALYERIVNNLEKIRDNARQPGSTITELDYQIIGSALYAPYIDDKPGLEIYQIESLHKLLGLYTGKYESPPNHCLNDILDSSLLNGLEPGQIAQVNWIHISGPDQWGNYTTAPHAFIIGRFQSGEWFLSDQGMQPSTEIIAPDYRQLRQELVRASGEGEAEILTGCYDISGLWTGVMLLAGPESVMEKAAELVPSGTYLGKAKAGGMLTRGNHINSGQFVSRHYSRSDAHVAAGKVSSHGVLIVEMPEGVFNVYETDMVRTPNVGVQSLDSSAGGLLTQQTFYSAELVLTDGNQANLICVY